MTGFRDHNSSVEGMIEVFSYNSAIKTFEIKTLDCTGESMECKTHCLICLFAYRDEQYAVFSVPTCSHLFHFHCWRSWTLENDTCPLCRKTSVETCKTLRSFSLCDAYKTGFTGIVKSQCRIVIDDGKSKPDLKTELDTTALHTLVRKNKIEDVRALILSGVNLDVTNAVGFTPLQIATINGQEEIVQILLKNGANLNLECNHLTALRMAVQNSRTNIIKAILQAKVNLFRLEITKDLVSQHQPMKWYIKIAEAFLATNGVFSQRNELGENLLKQAVENECIDMVLVLLGAEIKPNVPYNSDGWTVLHLAVSTGNRDIVSALLRYSASVVIQNSNGLNALQLAVINEKFELVPLLLDAKAIFYQQVSTLPYRLRIAELSSEISTVFSKSSVNNFDQREEQHGRTLLQQAVQLCCIDLVDVLLGVGADPDLHDDLHMTPLIDASDRGYIKIVQKLLDAKANLKLKCLSVGTALSAAAASGHADVVKLLAETEDRQERQSHIGVTPKKSDYFRPVQQTQN